MLNLFKIVSSFIIFGVLSCIFIGCAADIEEVKKERDEAVYCIVEKKWQEDFGSLNNYRISDLQHSPGDIKPEGFILESGILTLPNAVALATTCNRQYQTEKEMVYLSAMDLTEVRHIYEPNPFFKSQGGYLDDEDGTRVGVENSLGFEQLLETGAEISAGIGLGWLDIITGDARSGVTTILTATVRQPLLRGAGRKVALENLTQADRNTLYQIRTFNRFRKEFVVSVITEYYRVLEAYTILENSKAHLNTLTNIYNRAQKLADTGKIPHYELEQAEQDKLEASDLYVQKQKEYKNVIDEFKILLALSPKIDLELDIQEMQALRDAGLQPIKCEEEYAISRALEQRLDLMNESDRVVDAERKIDVVLDATRAELNLIGYADRSVFGDAPGDSDQTREQYEASLELDLGLDRLKEKNDVRRALITFNQQKRNYQESADSITLQVKQAHRDLMESQERYHIQNKGLRLAEKRVKNTLLLLQYNRANTRDVLDAQEDVLDARNATTNALIDYAIATLNFYRDTGMLYVKPDGMWQGVAKSN